MDWRPSEKLRSLLTGATAWEDADPAIRSWARLTIHNAAKTICDADTRQRRQALLNKIPASIRPHVEARVKYLWHARVKKRLIRATPPKDDPLG